MSNNVVTLKSWSEVTQGHWKWCHSIDWVWFPIPIVTLSLKRTVFEIIDFENCRDLEIGVKGHSRSSESTRIDPRHLW